MNNSRFVFFGTPDIAVVVLDALHAAGMTPQCIVTAPDAPQGRGLVLTPSPVAQWAQAHGIETHKPQKLSAPEVAEALAAAAPDLFVVVAYGKIIPQSLLNIPKLGTLNMHPSLLPKHRGPSPIESQIRTETTAENVGVSVMLLDEKMDHGPILAQESVADELPQWPVAASVLRNIAAQHGAGLLVKTIPQFTSGVLTPVEQDHNQATYCSMIQKEDAQLDLADDPYTNYVKILAYDVWPRAYFFTEKNGKRMRVIVTSARFENGVLLIERVIPEGKREMSYKEFLS